MMNLLTSLLVFIVFSLSFVSVGCYGYAHPYDFVEGSEPLLICPERFDHPWFKLYRRLMTRPETLRIGRKSFNLDPKERIIYIVHGQYENGEKMWVLDLVRTLLMKESSNVIVYDWREGAFWSHYPLAFMNTRSFGTYLSLMMNHLGNSTNAFTNNSWCIGHGLGAHLCARAGVEVRPQMHRITGLDPDGPKLHSPRNDLRLGLHREAAKFVDVIHTSDHYGTLRSLGHLDIFINVSDKHTLCLPYVREAIRDHVCNHRASIEYFVRSISRRCFYVTTKCITKGFLLDCKDYQNEWIVMGYSAMEETPSDLYGTYKMAWNTSLCGAIQTRKMREKQGARGQNTFNANI